MTGTLADKVKHVSERYYDLHVALDTNVNASIPRHVNSLFHTPNITDGLDTSNFSVKVAPFIKLLKPNSRPDL